MNLYMPKLSKRISAVAGRRFSPLRVAPPSPPGVRALSTRNFPDQAGPLRQVH